MSTIVPGAINDFVNYLKDNPKLSIEEALRTRASRYDLDLDDDDLETWLAGIQDPPFNLRAFQIEQNQWAKANFPDRKPHQPLLGAVEEVGELAESLLALSDEDWRAVVGYEGLYEVSSLGNVRRIAGGEGAHPGAILKPRVGQDGYLRVVLYSGSKESARAHFIHSLVAEAFLGPRPEGFEVNHRDGNKARNDIYNLEYLTRVENQKHAVRLGLWKPKTGEEHGMAKLTQPQVDEIRDSWAGGTVTQRGLAEQYGVDRTTIGKIVNGNTWVEVTAHIDPPPASSLPHAVSALGRLAHAHLKAEQNIRGSQFDHLLAGQDAVGDIIIYLADYCSQQGWDLEGILKDTWEQVKKRNWRKDPRKGSE